jgi:hypothetical protein
MGIILTISNLSANFGGIERGEGKIGQVPGNCIAIGW